MILTHSHKDIPTTLRLKSHINKSLIPRVDIAARTKTLATHLTYQSRVYFGVADFKILGDFNSGTSFFCFSVKSSLDIFFIQCIV